MRYFKSEHLFILGLYKTAKEGKSCKDTSIMDQGKSNSIYNSITTPKECKTAQEILQKTNRNFKDSKFLSAEGNDFDLPHGCIYDTTNGNYVYWNAKGETESHDGRIRPICKRQGE